VVLLFVNIERLVNGVGGGIETRKKLRRNSRTIQEMGKIETMNGVIKLFLPDKEVVFVKLQTDKRMEDLQRSIGRRCRSLKG